MLRFWTMTTGGWIASLACNAWAVGAPRSCANPRPEFVAGLLTGGCNAKNRPIAHWRAASSAKSATSKSASKGLPFPCLRGGLTSRGSVLHPGNVARRQVQLPALAKANGIQALRIGGRDDFDQIWSET